MKATVPVLLAAALAAPSIAFAHDFVAASKLASKYVAIQFKDEGRTLTMFYDTEVLKCSRENNDPRCRAQLFEFDAHILMNTPSNVMNVVLVKRPSRSQTGRPYTLYTRDAYSTGGVDFAASRGVQASGRMDRELRELPLADYLVSLSFGRSAGEPVTADQVYVLIADGAPPQDLLLEPVELLSDWLVVKSADQKEQAPMECFRRRDLVDPRTPESKTSLDATAHLYVLQRTDLKHVGAAKIAHYSARPSGRFLKARAEPLYPAEHRILGQDKKEIEVRSIISLDQTEKDAAQPEQLFARVTLLESAPALPAENVSGSTIPGDKIQKAAKEIIQGMDD